jgi:adenylosuccinate synthase
MTATAIVGANWGDEGKGKMVDALAGDYDFVVRFQGGANAGHTVLTERGKFVLHLIPSGVLHPNVTGVLGPGVALDPAALERELAGLARQGVTPRLRISNRAQLLLQCHRDLDAWEEARLGTGAFGSTRSGIAPFYADKCSKIGVSVDDLFDAARLERRVEALVAPKNALLQQLYGRGPIDPTCVLHELQRARATVEPFVVDTTELLARALRDGRAVLLEGQLGALRDPDHGIAPFTTSSSPLAGYASVGAGVPLRSIERVIAVTKAYSTCVGAGPFVTELSGSEADELRERGGDAGEYGATTGRPRRVGWFDAVATRYGCSLQGATEVALTGLDTLGTLDAIPICTAYRLADGTVGRQFPTPRHLDAAVAHYELAEGWKVPLRGARRWQDLPVEARHYVDRVAELLELPVAWVSVGPERTALVRRP